MPDSHVRSVVFPDDVWRALCFIAAARSTTASELVRNAAGALLAGYAQEDYLIATALKYIAESHGREQVPA
jgi:hypothetical protein